MKRTCPTDGLIPITTRSIRSTTWTSGGNRPWSLTRAIRRIRWLRSVGVTDIRLARVKLPAAQKKGFIWFVEENGKDSGNSKQI